MHNEYPKVMMVSDNPITKNDPGEKRVVWAHSSKFHYPFFTYHSDIQTLKDIENIPEGEGEAEGFKYAQDPQQQIELTLDEIADKFGISVNQLKIKK